MNPSFVVFLIALWFASLSFNSAGFAAVRPDIENPSAELLAKEADILKRVVRIHNDSSSCSGTWLEVGIIASAKHCGDVVYYSRERRRNEILVQGIPTQVWMATTLPESTLPGLERKPVFGNSDYLLMLVDPKPLQALDLPTTAIDFVNPQPGAVAPGTEMLIAGYGLRRIAPKITDPMFKLAAGLVKTIAVDEPWKYDIEISTPEQVKATTLFVAADASAADPAPSRTRTTEFLSPPDSAPAMIMPGDSGGPAFRKNSAGRWELLGIASAIKGLVHDQPNMKVLYQVGHQSPETVEYQLSDEEWAQVQSWGNPDESIRDHLNRADDYVVRKILQLRYSRPFPSSLLVEKRYDYQFKGFHVNLANPEVNQALTTYRQQLRAELVKQMIPQAPAKSGL